MSVTKKLSIFSIDKELIEKFDNIIPNNEKSLRVELLIENFVKENPDRVRSLKFAKFTGIIPAKRGRQIEVKI